MHYLHFVFSFQFLGATMNNLNKICVSAITSILNLLESSSSSDDESIIVFNRQEERLRVKDFVVDVINLYTDSEFKNNLRVHRDSASYLVEKFSRSRWYAKRTYRGGKAQLTPEAQVLMFLWFCSNKTTIREVANLFNMSHSTVHYAFNRVLDFMVTEIAPEEIRFPRDAATKQKLANDFKNICGFPNVLGCIVGSYIGTRTPKQKIKSANTNQRDTISLPMQGICDANLKFLNVFTDVSSKIYDSFISKQLPQLTSPDYHLLGNSAYPLRKYLLTPYRDNGNLTDSEKVYNQKFCQTRVKIENAFGMLKCRFRQLMRLDFQEVETMGKLIIACCALHNICIDRNDFIETEEESIEPSSVQAQYIQDDVDERVFSELGEIKRNQIKNLLCTK